VERTLLSVGFEVGVEVEFLLEQDTKQLEFQPNFKNQR
jgi:hypothetical protein